MNNTRCQTVSLWNGQHMRSAIHSFIRFFIFLMSFVIAQTCAASQKQKEAIASPLVSMPAKAKRQPPKLRKAHRASQIGEASWYGPKFRGKLTSSGEVFDQHKLTAAHPTLPEGSTIKVTNLDNGRSVNLRVNNRGPFLRGRILDVSKRAAQVLGMLKDGTAMVQVKVLSRPD